MKYNKEREETLKKNKNSLACSICCKRNAVYWCNEANCFKYFIRDDQNFICELCYRRKSEIYCTYKDIFINTINTHMIKDIFENNKYSKHMLKIQYEYIKRKKCTYTQQRKYLNGKNINK